MQCHPSYPLTITDRSGILNDRMKPISTRSVKKIESFEIKMNERTASWDLVMEGTTTRQLMKRFNRRQKVTRIKK